MSFLFDASYYEVKKNGGEPRAKIATPNDAAGAERNFRHENRSFDGVWRRAARVWRSALGKLRVSGLDANASAQLDTALYHAFLKLAHHTQF